MCLPWRIRQTTTKGNKSKTGIKSGNRTNEEGGREDVNREEEGCVRRSYFPARWRAKQIEQNSSPAALSFLVDPVTHLLEE